MAHVELSVVNALGEQVDARADGGRGQTRIAAAGVGQRIPATPGAGVAGDVDVPCAVIEALGEDVALAVGRYRRYRGVGVAGDELARACGPEAVLPSREAQGEQM